MKLVLTYLLLFMIPLSVYSQVGIGTVVPNSSTVLDIASTTKGILIPRLTTLQRTSITSPSQSMTVFDTDVDIYYYYNNSNASWTPINVCSIKKITSSGAYLLKENDNGRILDFTSLASITIQVPNNLPIGFQVSVTQAGSGAITFTGIFGMTVNNRYGATKSGGKWAKMGLEVKSTTVCVLSGDVK